jgi:hypothetical protein
MRVTPKKKARVSQLLPPKKPFESKTSSPQVHFALENPYNKTPPRSPAPPSAPASAPPAFARDPAHYWGAHTDMNKSVAKRYPVIHRNETVDVTAHSTSSSPYSTPTVHLTSHPPMTFCTPRRMTVPFFPPSMYEGMDMDQFSLFFLVVSLLTVFRKRERTGKAE